MRLARTAQLPGSAAWGQLGRMGPSSVPDTCECRAILIVRLSAPEW